jgi:hypothetical protein
MGPRDSQGDMARGCIIRPRGFDIVIGNKEPVIESLTINEGRPAPSTRRVNQAS